MLALVVALVGKLAKVELTVAAVLRFVLLQAEAGLVGAVVEHELVVAACAVLAVTELLGFDAGKHGGVVMAVGTACKPARGVGCRSGGSSGNLVMGGVVLTLAVVQTVDDDGTIDVTFDEIHQHFLADAG